MPVRSFWPLALCLACLPLTAAPAHAEGSAQVGTNQGLQTDTIIKVDILNVSEDISWNLSTVTAGALRITDPNNNQVVNSNSATGTYDTQVIGTYRVSLKTAQTGAWDISVSGTGAGKGRIHSQNWHFTTGSFLQPAAASSSYYALVSGGQPNTNGVVELEIEGMSGNDYNVYANQTGVDGANAGRSVPTSGNAFTPQFEMYLLPPEISTYNPVTPTVSAYSFSAGAKGCNLIVPGSTTGTFKFTTNVAATYNLVCDLDNNGVFDRVGANDLLIVGTTVAGANSVAWDGKNNSGVNVPSGDYSCKVYVNVGELHFVGRDIETAYPGLRLFTVDNALTHSALTMFWNDTAVQANDVNMPAPTSAPGSTTSGAGGISSGTYGSAATPNTDSHGWGNFDAAGTCNANVNCSKGNNAFIDTFGSILSVASTVASLTATTSMADSDADTLGDYLESCTLGTDPNKVDTDNDTYDDNVEAPGGSAVDTDSDGTIDALDTDSDNDGVPDASDGSRTNKNMCRDQDGDGCDDCTNTGNNLSGGDITNDGTDTDGDTACNLTDPDDDNDGVPDATDPQPLNSSVCQDTDMDGCDDCAVVHTMGGDAINDGTDSDGDHVCNVGDPDDDNDGVPDAMDTNPTNASSCQDSDLDGCNDCVNVHTAGGDAMNDGADFDMDGLCDAGDLDDDNDGVIDTMDTAPMNSSSCRDQDADGCNDCVNVHTGGGDKLNDGPDLDMDGLCDAGDTDDDGDGVPDATDLAPNDKNSCRDQDGDTCDDCVNVHTGGGDKVNDGADLDLDGLCDAGDPDDDNDGVPDTTDTAPRDTNFCRDMDNDTCDDCTNVHTGGGSTSNDGADADHDGICDAGDAHTDSDGDGVDDGNDSAPSDPHVCKDSDHDSCNDCAVTGADHSGGDTMNDGADTDNDGICDAANDWDGDGVPDTNDVDIDGDGIPNVDEANDDTDGDGIDDGYDLDSDGDGLPDLVEAGGKDTDDDGRVDDFTDGNSDGIDDGVASSPLPRPDTDNDGFQDGVDLDSDGDGLSDVREAGGDARDLDSDADGRVDDTFDENQNGWDDSVDGGIDLSKRGKALAQPDSDGDKKRDWRDLDSDGDGVPDAIEGHDFDADGKSDRKKKGDANVDGLDDAFISQKTLPDRDGDKKPDYVDANDDGDALTTEQEVDDAKAHPEVGEDPDNDGTPSYLDPDSDGDGVNDTAESMDGGDLDHDGLPDYLDPKIYPKDSDSDGIPDYIERRVGSGGMDTDSDGDGRPDYLDPDDDGDGLPTMDERPDGKDVDHDGDGMPDYLDPDDDNDGVPTREGIGPTPSMPLDSDGDGKPNHLDTDDDNDGVPTMNELGADRSLQDTDADGRADYVDPDDDDDGIPTAMELGTDGSFLDTDMDGTPNHLDVDDDGDGLPTRNEITSDGSFIDTDEDGISNHLDADDDDDSVPTKDEVGQNGTPFDSDQDGTPDHLDTDDDGDGIPTSAEHPVASDGKPKPFKNDIDGDGVPNYLDLDSDGDGYSDHAESKQDIDGNGVPDYREPPKFGYAGGALCGVASVRGGAATLPSRGASLVTLFLFAGVLWRRRRRFGTGA